MRFSARSLVFQLRERIPRESVSRQRDSLSLEFASPFAQRVENSTRFLEIADASQRHSFARPKRGFLFSVPLSPKKLVIG